MSTRISAMRYCLLIYDQMALQAVPNILIFIVVLLFYLSVRSWRLPSDRCSLGWLGSNLAFRRAYEEPQEHCPDLRGSQEEKTEDFSKKLFGLQFAFNLSAAPPPARRETEMSQKIVTFKMYVHLKTKTPKLRTRTLACMTLQQCFQPSMTSLLQPAVLLLCSGTWPWEFVSAGQCQSPLLECPQKGPWGAGLRHCPPHHLLRTVHRKTHHSPPQTCQLTVWPRHQYLMVEKHHTYSFSFATQGILAARVKAIPLNLLSRGLLSCLRN